MFFFFFLSVRGKDLRELEGISYSSEPLIFSSPKLGEFGEKVVPLILEKKKKKKIKLSIIP